MKAKWKKRSNDTTNKHIKILKKMNPDIILIGTSMFERFNYVKDATNEWNRHGLDQCNIFNCGVGGDRIENILFRLKTKDILSHVQSEPNKIIIMCGANDIEENTPNLMIDGLNQILSLICDKFKNSEIIVLGMYPRKSNEVTESILYKKITQYNDMIQDLIKSDYDMIKYYYFGSDVLKGNRIDKKFFKDTVHFNRIGNNLFAKHLSELVRN